LRLRQAPITPGSLVVHMPGHAYTADDGNGHVIENPALQVGTIDYETGELP